jgi:hypothetical protein
MLCVQIQYRNKLNVIRFCMEKLKINFSPTTELHKVTFVKIKSKHIFFVSKLRENKMRARNINYKLVLSFA